MYWLNLKAEERTRAMLFIFCPCLITKSETDALIKILKEQLLNFKENIWQQIFRNKDYLESRNGERDFKIQIEKYIESQKEHGSGNITTFINAPIQMECGDWICDEQGVYKWVKDKEEENHQVFASKQHSKFLKILLPNWKLSLFMNCIYNLFLSGIAIKSDVIYVRKKIRCNPAKT